MRALAKRNSVENAHLYALKLEAHGASGNVAPNTLHDGRELLRVISEKAPGSLDELARITGKAKSNLSRTLRTMEGYGLVRLERGEHGRIMPKVMHDRVELDLSLTLSQKAG